MSTRRRRSRRQSESAPVAGVFILLIVTWSVASGAANVPWRWVGVALIFVITLSLFLGRAARVRSQRRAEEQMLLADTRSLTPTEFELRIKHLLAYLGWEQLHHRGGSGDRGVDLLGSWRGERCIVQCKLYRDLVPPEFLRSLEGTRIHEQADRAFLITTGRIAQQGRDWIRGKPIEIWDGELLATLFHDQRTAGVDPGRQQRERQRSIRFTAGLAVVNLLALLVAISLPAAAPTNQPAATADGFAPPAAPASAPAVVAARSAELAAPASAQESCGVRTISGVEMLLLRTAPGKQAAEMDAYPAGTRVTLLCAKPVVADGIPWRNVRIGQAEGWMSGRFLK